jgi:hypothetical protein
MLLELLRLLRKPQRYVAAFRNGEIYIVEKGTEAPRRALPVADHVAFPGE